MNDDCWFEVFKFVAQNDILKFLQLQRVCKSWAYLIANSSRVYKSYLGRWKLRPIEGMTLQRLVCINVHRFCQKCNAPQDMPIWDHLCIYMCLSCRTTHLRSHPIDYSQTMAAQVLIEPHYSTEMARKKLGLPLSELQKVPYNGISPRKFYSKDLLMIYHAVHGNRSLTDLRHTDLTHRRRRLMNALESENLLDHAHDPNCQLYYSRHCSLETIVDSLRYKNASGSSMYF
jgi:hypothetical protein